MEAILNEKWIRADRPVVDYPIGTKFKALMGGHWIRTKLGFKWCTGATFPRPGGDWTGQICLPLSTGHASIISDL
jgi:hypothetical protein